MSVAAQFLTRVGDFRLEAELTCEPGQTVALLGPNGAGKSTVLRSIAGLLPIDEGSIEIDGRPVDDPASRVFVPPEQRSVGVVFQDYLLFPHMTVRQNIEFGPRNQRSSLYGASNVDAWIETFDLTELLDRKPGELSGGQAQRVALARALATDPRLLLLDEPLSALDAATKANVRAELRHFLQAFEHGTVIVTHDPLDALVLADRIVVVESGRVTQEGFTAEVASAPRTDYLAALLGVSLIRGTMHAGTIACDGGGELVTSSSLEGSVAAVIRPQAISLHTIKPEGSARNVWHTTVTNVEAQGDHVRVSLAGPPSLVAAVTPAVVAEMGIVPGREIYASLKATDIAVYPA